MNKEMLAPEVQKWIKQGIISTIQANEILALYAGEVVPWYKKTNFMVSSVGALIITLGIILLISENWSIFPVWIQSMTGFLPWLGINMLGIYAYIKEYKQRAEILFFMGTMLLGVNIYLQAQIYHISAYYPNGVLWWIIGSLPVAWLLRSHVIFLLINILFTVWSSMQIDHGNYEFISMGLLLLIGLFTWLNPSRLLLVFTLFNVFLGIGNLFDWWHIRLSESLMLYYLLSSLILPFGVFNFFRSKYSQDFILLLRMLVLLSILMIVYAFSFNSTGIVYGDSILNIKSLPVGIYFIGLGYLLFWALNFKFSHTLDFLGLSVIGLFWFMGILVTYFNFSDLGVQIFCNILLIVSSFYLIYEGMKSYQKSIFFLGVAWILMLTFGRFIDFSANYVLGAILFIAGGILILYLNRYWTKNYEKNNLVDI